MGEAGKADAQASATTMAEVATSNRVIRNRGTPGSNTGRPHGSNPNHNSRPHGSNSSSSSDNIRSHNSGDHGISSSSPGPAGRDHLPNSRTGAERLTSGDNNTGEEISCTGTSCACVSGVAKRSTSPQSAGQLRPHQRRSIVRMRHHLQELMSRSTAPALLPRGHRTIAMDVRPRQTTGLRRHTTAMHLPRRCHHRPDLTDHLHRRLSWNPIGASRPGTPTLYRHITCPQASV